MMKRNIVSPHNLKWKSLLFPLLTLLWMLVIFLFSAQDGSSSSSLSQFILDILPFWPKEAGGEDSLLFGFLPLRKLAHMAEYAVLGILVFGTLKTEVQRKIAAERQFRRQRGDNKMRLSGFWRIGFYAWLLSVFYAVTDEIHQLFVPGRAGRLLDVGIDGIGAAVGILLVLFLLMGINHRKRTGSGS